MKPNRSIQEWPAKREKRIELARRVFGESLISCIRENLGGDLVEQLVRPDTKLAGDERKLSTWLKAKDDSERAQVANFANYVADLILFRVLNLLDGTTGGYPLDDCLSDFILALGVYDSEQEYVAGRASEVIRLNSPTLVDLHDLYDEWMEEFEENG